MSIPASFLSMCVSQHNPKISVISIAAGGRGREEGGREEGGREEGVREEGG